MKSFSFSIKTLFMILVVQLFFSCGGGSGSEDNSNNSNEAGTTISYKRFILYGKNLNGTVGFEVTLSVENNANYTVEKLLSSENWEIRNNLEKNTLKILAFNKDLEPLNNNNEEEIPLISIEFQNLINVELVNVKAVDEFGNPLDASFFIK